MSETTLPFGEEPVNQGRFVLRCEIPGCTPKKTHFSTRKSAAVRARAHATVNPGHPMRLHTNSKEVLRGQEED